MCILAYWHKPRWSSGHDGNTAIATSTSAFWEDLYIAGADVVLSGHSHHYERFAQQDPQGVATTNGIREFVVGTGGHSFTGFWTNNMPNSQVRDNRTFGILKITLHESSYVWQFIPSGSINGFVNGTFTDSGSTSCH